MVQKMQLPPDRPAPGTTSDKLVVMKTQIVDLVIRKIDALLESKSGLALPPNYHHGTALAAAMLAIAETVDRNKNAALAVCSSESISQAMLSMVVQGLSPQRMQCYFVVYGSKLVCMRSYFGTESVVMRIFPGALLATEVIYVGDIFNYEIVGGRKVVTEHQQKFENIKGLDSVVGGYGIWTMPDGRIETSVMTIHEIKNAWRKGKVYVEGKEGTTHEQHPADMVKKTVCNNVSKRLINSADDSYLVLAVAAADDASAGAAIEAEVDEHANTGKALDFPPPDAAVVEVVRVQPVVPVDGSAAIAGVTEQAWEPAPEPGPIVRTRMADNPNAKDPTDRTRDPSAAGAVTRSASGPSGLPLPPGAFAEPQPFTGLPRAPEPTPTTTPPPGTATAAPVAPPADPPPEEPVQLRESTSTGPYGRFLDLLAKHGLDEERAMKVLATVCKVDTLRDEDYKRALTDPRSFLALYHGALPTAP